MTRFPLKQKDSYAEKLLQVGMKGCRRGPWVFPLSFHLSLQALLLMAAM